jgi:hypothetical protein
MKVFIYNRFLIVEITKLYHPGASMKNLGKRWFAFSRPDASGGWLSNRGDFKIVLVKKLFFHTFYRSYN